MAEQGMRERVLRKFVERQRETARRIADRVGQPLAHERPSERELAAMWDYSPHPNPDEVAAQLLAQGVPPALLIRGHLDKERTQPNQAAVWPHRADLIGSGGPTRMVERAERLAKLAERYRATGMDADETTVGEMP